MHYKLIVVIGIFFILEVATALAEDNRLTTIIEQVQLNESHYANLELAFEIDYRQFHPPLTEEINPAESHPILGDASSFDCSYIKGDSVLRGQRQRC